jgi:hypothetical protein
MRPWFIGVMVIKRHLEYLLAAMRCFYYFPGSCCTDFKTRRLGTSYATRIAITLIASRPIQSLKCISFVIEKFPGSVNGLIKSTWRGKRGKEEGAAINKQGKCFQKKKNPVTKFSRN